MMQVILSNSKHPEYGQATIPLPLAQDQYEDCVELLEKLEIGDVVERDCKVEEIQGGLPILKRLLMCDKEAIEVQKILPFLSDTWPLCRIGRAVIRASQSCRQSCNKSQCPACGCRSHHSCTHAPQFSRSFPAREWGSVLQRQGACGQCP